MKKAISIIVFLLLVATIGGFTYTKLGSPQLVTVDYWIDGDTVVITEGTHVRLADIDAPEIDTPEGADAKRYIREAYSQGSILVMKIKETQKEGDAYGRTVAYLYPLMGESLNKQLIKAGHAHYNY